MSENQPGGIPNPEPETNVAPANLNPDAVRAGEIRERAPQDAAGVADRVAVNQPNPNISRGANGEVVYDEGVSGPDPRFWGRDEDRPDPFEAEKAAPKEGEGGVAPDTISPEGISGPDSRWWGQKEADAEGVEQHVGRDDLNYLQPPPEAVDQRPPELIEAQRQELQGIDEAAAANTITPPTEEATEGGSNGA